MTTQGELLDRVEKWKNLYEAADTRVAELEAKVTGLEDTIVKLLRVFAEALLP